MKNFFDKQPVIFAVILIVIYVVGMSALQDVSASIGTENLCEAVFCGALTVFLLVFAKKYGLFGYLGLKKSEVAALRMLIYIPLFLVAFSRMLAGTGFVFDAALLFRTIKMLFVGFVEEVLFRGFLFKGIVRENGAKPAIIISALTFGFGHIVNLIFNGYELLDSLTQIAFAVVCGFMLVMIYVRTDSIIACVIFHSLNNTATGYSNMNALYSSLGEQTGEIVWCCICILIMLGYTLYVVKALPKREISIKYER